MRQSFPRVALRDREVFDGFLDGYADGDGCRAKHWAGRTLVSANVPFLVDLAAIIGARFTPARKGLASHLTVVDRWAARGTFRPEHHDAEPVESNGVTVEAVRPRTAPGKPFTLYRYRYRLRPHPTFLVNGHLSARRSEWTGRPPYAAAAPVPSWSLPFSGRRQTRSRKSAAAMTAMPATTAAPA